MQKKKPLLLRESLKCGYGSQGKCAARMSVRAFELLASLLASIWTLVDY